MDTTIQFRTTKKAKEGARTILAGFGLDLSTAMNMYISQVNRQKGLAIQGLTENGFTPEFEARMVAETKDIIDHPEKYKGYSSAKELIDDILHKK